MGLNQVKLPASLIANFYKNHLVEAGVKSNFINLAVSPAATNIHAEKGMQYLGENKRGICLLVNYVNDVYLPDEQLHFLTTILQACKLDLGDVAIVNCKGKKISFDELCRQITVNYLLVFGDDLLMDSPGEISLFTIQNINDCYVVYSPAPEQLNNKDPESKLLKSRLWICLKQLFGI